MMRRATACALALVLALTGGLAVSGCGDDDSPGNQQDDGGY